MKLFQKPPADEELIDKTVLPSAYQQMAAENQHATKVSLYDTSLFTVTVVYTFKDKVSGRIRQVGHSS